MIRHTETDKTPIKISGHVDYLFLRMFALIRLVLHMTGREAIGSDPGASQADDDFNW
ncbi:MAG: hypothetical protein WAM39_13905 [Bryobacteraceae bacterium]